MVSNSLLYLLISTGLTIPPERTVTTDKPFDVTDAEELSRWTRYDEKFEDHVTDVEEDVTRPWPEANVYRTENPDDEFSTLLVTEDLYTEKSTAWPGYGETHAEREDLHTEKSTPWPGYGEKHAEREEKRECPLGEHYTSYRKKCEKTCSDSPNQILCLLHRTKGCICDRGLVRNQDGKCISLDQCQNITESCPPGEKWSDCISWCYSTCEDVGKTVICPTPEGHPCPGGCVCEDPEAVRGPDEKCIKPSLCPSANGSYTCHQNEHYESCGTACPHTCFDKRSCPSNCCVEGCFCNEGLLRGPDGNCIQPQECPPDSKHDEASEISFESGSNEAWNQEHHIRQRDQGEPARAELVWPRFQAATNKLEDPQCHFEGRLCPDGTTDSTICNCVCKATGADWGECTSVGCMCSRN